MGYSIKRISETEASIVVTDFLINWEVSITKMAPKTYGWGVATNDASISTSDGTLTDNGDSTYILGANGTYKIGFSSDGVYKINLEAKAVLESMHFAIVNATLKEQMAEQLTNIVYCFPEVAYDCANKIDTQYNVNVQMALIESYFYNDIDISFNYGNLSIGTIYKGYKYECSYVGSGSRDFTEGTTLLLEDSSYNLVPDSTALTLNEVYTCINTGDPDDWGGTVLSPYTTVLNSRFMRIADAIDRISEYGKGCTIKNTCSCR